MIDGKKKRITKEFGNNLKKIRKAQRMSLRELAASAGIEHAQIFRIETGLVDPKITTVVLLAEALGIQPGELFGKK